MKSKIFIILLLLLFLGCQPAIKFSSRSNYVKTNRDTTQTSKNAEPEKKPNINKIKPELKDPIRKKIIDEAFSWIGTSYCYGGTTKNCVDCSGFTQLVFLQNGFILPRTAKEQYEFSKKIKQEEALPADLVFFQDKNKINHVGIYIGNDEFIHSSSSIGVVKQSINDAYFKNRFVCFGRVINY